MGCCSFFTASKDGDEMIHDSHTELNHVRRMSAYYREKLKWIIFPTDKWVQKWDLLVLVLLLVIFVTLPYQFGVSAGYYIYKHDGWFAIMFSFDVVFLIDTMLYFFRPYRDTVTEKLIINRKKICFHYLKSGFFLNFISSASFPSLIFRKVSSLKKFTEEASFGVGTDRAIVLILYGIRMTRLARIRTVLQSSKVLRAFLESKHALPHRVDLIKSFLILFLVSHWSACMWSGIVYFQAQSFGKNMLYHKNWMSHWYNETYKGKGGRSIINPIGWERDKDRYMLSLYWTVQSITSIGYGNVLPFTKIEWIFSCIFMLFIGVFWATIVAKILNIVSHMMSNEVPLSRLHDANVLINKFAKDRRTEKDESSRLLRADISSRIKRYILDQRDKGHTSGKCTSTLGDDFEIYDSLSVELQRLSSYAILRPFLDMVPYLSSKFLSVMEQALVSSNCIFHHFSAGETVSLDTLCDNRKRGILIILQGAGFLKQVSQKEHKAKLSRSNRKVFGYEEALLKRSDCTYINQVFFPCYTKALFIPQAIIWEALKRNPQAWKNCARWKYLQILLRQKFVHQVFSMYENKEESQMSW